MRIDKTCGVGQIFDAAAVEHLLVDDIQSIDVRIAVRFDGAPIVPFNRNVETIVSGVLELVSETRRVPHYFLRHATDVHAGAA